MRKCPACGSVFVCWNWVHTTKEVMEELNPDRSFTTDQWYHECWDCEDVFVTGEEVKDGIEYKQLCKLWIPQIIEELRNIWKT